MRHLQEGEEGIKMPRGSFDALSGALQQKPPAGGGMARPVMHEETRPRYEQDVGRDEAEIAAIKQELTGILGRLQSGAHSPSDIGISERLLQKLEFLQGRIKGMGTEMEGIQKEHDVRSQKATDIETGISGQGISPIMRGQ